MKGFKAGALLALIVVFVVAGLAVAPAQDLQLSRGLTWGVAQTNYATSVSRAAATRYGNVINCSNAKAITFGLITGAGCGATSKVTTWVEWLGGDPGEAVGIYQGITGYVNGYALPTGYWGCQERLLFTIGSATDATTNILTTASSKYVGTIAVRAPYCRLAVAYAVADIHQGTLGTASVTAHHMLGYMPFDPVGRPGSYGYGPSGGSIGFSNLSRP